MIPFEAKLKSTPVEHILTLSGPLDESAELPKLKEKKNIRVHLGRLTHVSSHGIKIWCKWLLEHDQWPAILLEECPHLFVRNFSSLKGFLTPNVSVLSFYVPFYSEATDEAKDVLFLREREFKKDGSLNIPKVMDSRGQAMEMDVIEAKYFSFLKP
ncbi:MAG: hypothetical protein ACAH59_01700 [Pseudobdellovibrionaceae bacterium]